METEPDPKNLAAFVQKMRSAHLDPIVIDTFAHYYKAVVRGHSGLIRQQEIRPIDPEQMPHHDHLKAFAEDGRKILGQAVMIVLNGGLGTGMGLLAAKSLIEAKAGKSFLEITLLQARTQQVRVCFMNSFNTHHDTLAAIGRIHPPVDASCFIQNQFPKINTADLTPAVWPRNPRLEWNPPGHGDIYTALFASGTLQSLLDAGFRYAFISNSDNLGGTLDAALLGYMAARRIPFLMEIARRRPSDMKGGHLAWHRNGRIVLREIAQCHTDDLEAFQNIALHRFFNTNNIWIGLEPLKGLIDRYGLVRLPMILNRKPLDPRDDRSPPVYQIETAMGAAVSLFDHAAAIRVERNRFLPVKTCNDLMVLRSDRYQLTDRYRLIRNPANRTETATVQLDPAFYGRIDLFDSRFPEGIPSLRACESLSIRGDVRFEKNVLIRGRVLIHNRRARQAVVRSGTVIENDLYFD